jgi:putative ABC transport system permease protein
MFILRQLSNNINTNVASITVISILLLITINILSSVISVANVYNSNLKNNNLSDFTINGTFYALGEPHIFAVESLVHEERFQKYVKEFALYDLYQSDELTLETLLTPAVKERIHKEEPAALFKRNISLMKESDFHRLMEVMHQPDLIFDITPEQYLLAANLQQMVTYYQPTLQDHHLLSFQGHSLAPATTTVLVTSLNNSSNANNQGVLIVDDSLLFPLEKNETKLVGNYNTFDTPEHIETAFTAFIAEKLKNKRTTEFLLTRQTMEIAGIGLGVIVSFVGLYVGIIFAICCVTILAVKQLSETSDTKERYQLLRKL